MRLNQWAESCDPRQLRLGEHKKQLHAQGRVNAQGWRPSSPYDHRTVPKWHPPRCADASWNVHPLVILCCGDAGIYWGIYRISSYTVSR